MSDKTAIEWTDATWNPVTGCTKVSPGCDNCYAETLAERFRGTPGHYFEHGFDVQLRPDKLDLPLHWTKPRRVFVNSISDLFHDRVADEYIAKVFAVMAAARQHTFQLLTKRHGRMRALLSSERFPWLLASAIVELDHPVIATWPLPNVWMGVSVENQQWADIRIPSLLDTPAAVRFLSCEPLLGHVDLDTQPWRPIGEELTRIDWIIVGGESGQGARPMHPDWARFLRDQCQQAGVPFLFKQHGEWAPIGPLYGDSDEVDEAHMEAVGLEVVDHKQVVQLERSGEIVSEYQPTDPQTWLMARTGKKAAGRELDGRTWDEYPEVHR